MAQPTTYDARSQEVYTICGKDPDPTGSGLVGQSSQISLERAVIGRTLVKAEEGGQTVLLEVDVYPLASGNGLELLVLCPRCRHQIRITSERKEISYELERTPAWVTEMALQLEQPILAVGELSVEPFGCTWELDDGHGRKRFGNSLCGWRVGIDRNVARRA